MQLALEDLKSDRLELVGTGVAFDEYTKLVGIDEWQRIERQYGDGLASGAGPEAA
jgi:hypothetical protein